VTTGSLCVGAIKPFTETGVLVMVRGGSSVEIAMACQRLADIAKGWPGVIEVTPGLDSIAVRYDPDCTSFDTIRTQIVKLDLDALPLTSGGTSQGTSWGTSETAIDVPVCFEAPYAPDLATVCAQLGMGPTTLIDQLTDKPLPILNMGFAPGFAYMGGLSGVLAAPERLPRRAEPRRVVPAGSLAMAAGFAGLYSCATPGGWHLIGRTPLTLFDANAAHPFILHPGRAVQLRPMTELELQRYTEQTLRKGGYGK